MASELSPALASAANCLAQPFNFGLVEVYIGHSKEGRDGVFRRAGEVRANDMCEDIVARPLS